MSKRILVLAAIVLSLSACGGSGQPVTEIVLDAADFAYSPISVTVPAGRPVMLTLKNSGFTEHDFVIDRIAADVKVVQEGGSDAHHAHGEEKNYDLHFSAQPGETSVIEVTISEPGAYTFYCSVAGHKEAGMLGELVVVAEE